MKPEDYYEIIKVNEHLVVIRESLVQIEPNYLVNLTNIYLLLGTHSALLIDTGCGMVPLKPIIAEYIEDRALHVVNTHFHFDHSGGNHEFEKIYIHESEASLIEKERDLSFLTNTPQDFKEILKKRNYKLLGTTNAQKIKEGYSFKLGGLNLTVLHTPGHSRGSVCLYSDRGHLFTGDLAYYGTLYLPPLDQLNQMFTSIQKLIKITQGKQLQHIYPAHEEYDLEPDLLWKLQDRLSKLETLMEGGTIHPFTGCLFLEDDPFNYMIRLK